MSTPGSPRWKQISLDALSWLIFLLMVPAHHALVALWQAVDWAAINRICAPRYRNSQRGQRAWAPAQMVAFLVLFLVAPVSSETALVQTVAIVPLYRWFCGFGLFSRLPDHSTLHTFRKEVGVERFAAMLTWVVSRCLKQGLITNELAFFDLMGVSASAHTWTPYERAVLLSYALIRYLELAEQGQAPEGGLPEALRQLAAEVAIEVLDNKQLLKEAPKAAQRVLKSLARWKQRLQVTPGCPLWEMSLEESVQVLLAEETRPLSPGGSEPAARRAWLKQVAQALKARLPHARGDLEARVGWVNDVTLKCGYWLGFLVDSFHSIITAVRVVPLNAGQHHQMIPALDIHRERTGSYPKAVAADSAQDYYPVHRALDQRQIEGHIASRTHQAGGGGLSTDHFTWNAAGQLVCPAGQAMQPGQSRRDGLIPYRAVGCVSCPAKTECLPKGQQPNGPRLIHLDPAAHQRWLQNREHTHTKAYQEAQSQRFASEGLFGLARRLYGMEKMPYRSASMNLMAGLLLTTVMNLAVLSRYPSRLCEP